jgi:hypothetical protein
MYFWLYQRKCISSSYDMPFVFMHKICILYSKLYEIQSRITSIYFIPIHPFALYYIEYKLIITVKHNTKIFFI